MWASEEFRAPGDLETAAQQYFVALGTARARRARAPDSAHQYDLISSYLALRSFRNLVRMSNVHLTQGRALREIAAWHRELLTRVPRHGLEVIFTEGASIAGENATLVEMYRRQWAQVGKLDDPTEALATISRFRESMDNEVDRQQLLVALGLTREEIILSANEYAARALRARGASDATVAPLVSRQIDEARKLLDSRLLKQRLKLEKDLMHLTRIARP